VDSKVAENITRFSVRGVSRPRRNLRRSSYSPRYREEMGAAVALVGRLVDIAAALTHLAFDLLDHDWQRMSRLAENIRRIRADLLSGWYWDTLETEGGLHERLFSAPWSLPLSERGLMKVANSGKDGENEVVAIQLSHLFSARNRASPTPQS
jgi:hypothetical protein